MKVCIKNQFGNKILLDVTKNTRIKDLLKKLHENNIVLKDHLSFENYEQAVTLSLNGMKLESEHSLEYYGIDVLLDIKKQHKLIAASDLDLIPVEGINIPGLDDLSSPDQMHAATNLAALLSFQFVAGAASIQLATTALLMSTIAQASGIGIISSPSPIVFHPRSNDIGAGFSRMRVTPSSSSSPESKGERLSSALNNTNTFFVETNCLHYSRRWEGLQQTARLGYPKVNGDLIKTHPHYSSQFQASSLLKQQVLIYLDTGRITAILRHFFDCIELAPFSEAELKPLAEPLRNPQLALQEISGLDRYALKVLCHLYPHQVRGRHLREFHGPNNEPLSQSHYAALLIRVEKGDSVDESITDIRGMTQEDVAEFVRNAEEQADIYSP